MKKVIPGTAPTRLPGRRQNVVDAAPTVLPPEMERQKLATTITDVPSSVSGRRKVRQAEIPDTAPTKLSTAASSRSRKIPNTAPTKLPLSPAMRLRLQRPKPANAKESNGATSEVVNGIGTLEESLTNLSLNANVESQESYKLDFETQYAGALKSSGQYFVIGNGEAVAVAGWDEREDQVNTKEFCVVTPLKFVKGDGNTVILLECSCIDGKMQRQELRGFDNALELSEPTVSRIRCSYCIHCSIVNRLGIQLNVSDCDVDIQSSDVEPIEQHMPEPCLLWSVRANDGTYGMVRPTRSRARTKAGFFCLTCRKDKCSHVYLFCDLHVACGIEVPPILPPEDKSMVLSKEEIVLQEGLWSEFSYPFKGDLIPVTDSERCQHGELWKNRIVSSKCVIYNLLGRPYDGGKVENRVSNGACKCVQNFDGRDVGVVNVNNKYFVEYPLLVYYMGQLARDGRPLTAYYDSLADSNRELSFDTIPEEILYRAWTGFAELLVLDESPSFLCQECGREPPMIVLDGTALSCRRDRMPSSTDPGNAEYPLLHGASHEDRVFVPAQKTRNLLLHFATGEVKGKKREMDADDVQKLLERARNEFPGSALLHLLQRLSSDGRRQAADSYRLFLVELAKNTPICGHLQIGHDFEDALNGLLSIASGEFDIATAADVVLIRKMRTWYPGIVKCLLPIRLQCGELPVEVRGIVRMLVRKLQSLLSSFDHRSDNDYPAPSTEFSPLSFFPNWPLQRGHGKYTSEPSSKDEADTCSKFRHGHKVLGPGIVVYLCPHGICYGFSVMENYESPRMPFETFCTRNYVPKNVVYDNACKLHVYCLKREPRLFSRTRFFVDRFHWKNHKACSIGYCMDNYVSDSNVSGANSQVAEQLNACLEKLRRSLSFMSYRKFFKNLKLFLYLYNRKKRQAK